MENVSKISKTTSSSNKLVYFLIAIIVILAIVLAGIGGFLMGQKNNQQKNEIPSQNVQITSAPTQNTSIETSTPIPTIDEESVLKQAIKNGLIAKHGNQAGSMTITVSKIKGDYASGGATEQGGGGMWFAAKVNGEWKLVWDGNGTISCSIFTTYPDYPTDMIPECWDDKAQQSIKR
jgi:hypothetical protein